MNQHNQMMAEALKSKFNASNLSIQDFLKSIPNSIGVEQHPEHANVYSTKLCLGFNTIVEVSSNGVDFSVESLT